MNDSVVKYERGERVRGSDLPWCTVVLTLRPVMCGGADQTSVKNTFGDWCVEN